MNTQTNTVDELDRLKAENAQLLSALVSLEQAYSNRHSPQHRAACLAEARTVLAKAKE